MTAPIMYVEDEEDYQILVRRILRRAGLAVVIASTGEEGLKALARERPSLLILDINLPDTDGYSLCNQLRQDPSWIDLPILMLTVRRRPDEWLRGFSSGADDYISKPLNPPELVERVVNCLCAADSWRTRQSRSGGEGKAEYNLIQAAVSGNRAAFEILIEKYKGRLIESLRSMTHHNDAQAEDTASHAFALAFENLDQFRGQASFYTCVYRIAVNDLMGTHRQPSAVSLDHLADGGERPWVPAAAEPQTFDAVLADRELGDKARAVMGGVAEPYRQILDLYFLQDLSYEVIAKKLRIPEGTVMSRLYKARRLLLEAWHEKKFTLL